MADIKKLAEELVKLTVLEVNELKNHLKKNTASSQLLQLSLLLVQLLAVTLPLLTKKLSSQLL